MARPIKQTVHHWWAIGMFAIVLVGVIISPLVTYHKGTSENITVELVAAPYADSPTLKYKWSGNIVRSCPITIRRQFIDADNVIWELTPSAFTALPNNRLGPTEYEIEAQTPEGLPEGETTYQVTEVPQCSWMQRWWPIEIPYPSLTFTVTR